MPWPRPITVTIAGTDFTGDTLDGVIVANGARTWWEQTVNGYARVTLYDQQPNVAIGDQLAVDVDLTPDPATGGTITQIVDGGIDYILHTFTGDGTFVSSETLEVDYLIIGGGGGAGGGTVSLQALSGGGGAGGYLTGTMIVTPGSYPVTVGSGGAGGSSGNGTAGQNSSALGQTAIGGGRGSHWTAVGGNGGSGGGGGGGDGTIAGGTATSGQGFAGGTGSGTFGIADNGGGGGGGAGQAGQPGGDPAGPYGTGGAGGNGLSSTITGISVTRAGGGGGNGHPAQTSDTFAGVGGSGGGGRGRQNGNGDAGTVNTGSGGGAGRRVGGAGGSGVVYIRYRRPTGRLFTGTVASIDTQLSLAGPFWTVTATGPLTKAGRRVLLDPIASGLDGDQIEALVIDGLSITWNETPGDWDSQTLTWDEFAVDTTEIDTPGVYQLADITDTPANILDLLELVARSGQGWLYETPDGVLGYGDSTRRETTPADDFITVPGIAVDLTSVAAQQTEGDIVNKAVVEWSGGEETINLITSQSVYGLYERAYETSLDVQADAIAYGLRRVELDGAPRTTFPSGIRVDLFNLADDQLDELLGIRRNYGLIVEDFPTYLKPEGLFRGFVEGYVWTIGPLTAYLDIYPSDYALSVFGLRWAATGTVAWQDVAATVTWADTEESL